MATNIYANVAADPTLGAVKSEVYPSATTIPAVRRGDKVTYNVYLVDGAGNFDTTSGVAGHTLVIAIGQAGSTALASISFTGLITNGWTGVLDLTGQGIIDVVAGKSSTQAIFELEVTTDATGNKRTYIQAPVTILNKLL